MFKKYCTFLVSLLCLLTITVSTGGCKKKTPDEEIVTPFVRLLEHQSFFSKILNREIHYATLLPAEYENSTTSFPVVYLLHGYGENETGWYKGGNVQYYTDQFASETIPMIYVMPEGFNSYYVNRCDGQFNYMDMFVKELVPHIDSVFRTIKDAQHRAVMGYSMGGYGAFILPIKNPGVFKTSVVLSMSFRTDEQYLAEPQGVFNMQWGSIFGGSGATGEQRITEYFKEYSPFHFLGPQSVPSLSGLNLFIDCGDDEETLTVTSDALHDTLRTLGIPHEFRIRNGAHTWWYWHGAMAEALKYISGAFMQIQYPETPVSADTCADVPANRITSATLSGTSFNYNVLLPPGYDESGAGYPLLVILHDRANSQEEQHSQRLYALLNGGMNSGRLPKSLVLEIPLQQSTLTSEIFDQVVGEVKNSYHLTDLKNKLVIAGNRKAGAIAFELAAEASDTISSCLLFDADIPINAALSDNGISYYLDISEKGVNYQGYHALYCSIRQKDLSYEYRVRQGNADDQSFLNGLNESFGFISNHLKK